MENSKKDLFNKLMNMLFSKIDDEKLILIKDKNIQSLIDAPDDSVKQFIDWVNSTSFNKVGNFQKFKNFLKECLPNKEMLEINIFGKKKFICEILVSKTSAFSVYKYFARDGTLEIEGNKFFQSTNFFTSIIDPLLQKKKLVSIIEPVKLKKFSIEKIEASDVEKSCKPMSVETFAAIMLNVVLSQKNGIKVLDLENEGGINIFFVEIEEGNFRFISLVSADVEEDQREWQFDLFRKNVLSGSLFCRE